ncbi:MAG: hypothetical protein MR845_03540 [Subdoligranulum variabile]|nr:hypothetical protein [Subdoligranulum variabile]
MDAVEFFKTVNRLCKNQSCKECPVYKKDMCCMVGFDDDSIKSIEETVSKVEQWAKDHLVKTRQSELLKMFPNVKIDDGVISFCPSNFLPEVERSAYCKKHDKCRECRKNYWLTEVTDND